MIVAVLRVIDVHSEQTTPGLSNTYGQALIFTAYQQRFDHPQKTHQLLSNGYHVLLSGVSN
jgi:hypothetical protein